jgi:uncharacterized integral membrane protein (TIGR00698 family)
MNLVEVATTGARGFVSTAVGITAALTLSAIIGKLFKTEATTGVLIGVGTAICGGSAIAAVTGVIRPKQHEATVALAIVFVLNAIGLVVFPLLGHLLGLSEPVFGRWAALAIHDTSSVVGAGLAYGPVALSVATTTKLARALWIVPVTVTLAITRRHGRGEASAPRVTHWPWFILGFVATAAAFTWSPALAPASAVVVAFGRRALVLALFLIGVSLSRDAFAKVGVRPFVLGAAVWIAVAVLALPLAMWSS